MEKIVLLDTSVIIQMYRGDQAILRELRRIGNGNLAISSVVAGELMYGARNKRELTTIKEDIASLNMIFSTESSERLALEFMSEYSLSHSQALPDALIAASSITNRIPLFTLNIKDFKFLPQIDLWEIGRKLL